MPSTFFIFLHNFLLLMTLFSWGWVMLSFPLIHALLAHQAVLDDQFAPNLEFHITAALNQAENLSLYPLGGLQIQR